MLETIYCECCGAELTEEEERAYYLGGGPVRKHDPSLLAATCAGCRERDRAVQERMHRVLIEYTRETGR